MGFLTGLLGGKALRSFLGPLLEDMLEGKVTESIERKLGKVAPVADVVAEIVHYLKRKAGL